MGRYFFVLFIFGFVSCAARETPPFEASFKTPEKTFQTWLHAARERDLALLVDTYAEPAKEDFRRKMNRTSEEAQLAMQDEARNTEFTIQKIVYEDRRAFVRILRERGELKEIEILNLIREPAGWKILP